LTSLLQELSKFETCQQFFNIGKFYIAPGSVMWKEHLWHKFLKTTEIWKGLNYMSWVLTECDYHIHPVPGGRIGTNLSKVDPTISILVKQMENLLCILCMGQVKSLEKILHCYHTTATTLLSTSKKMSLLRQHH
jgi:hypothetical protein